MRLPSRLVVSFSRPLARGISPLYLRTLSTTSTLLTNSKSATAKHPLKDTDRAASSGEPVSDYAKQDESKVTGLPEESSAGPPPSTLASLVAPSLFSLADRTVLITGGGRGVGLTIAQALLESGASVAALDVLPEPTEPAWSEASSFAKGKGLELTYHHLDVTNIDSVTKAFSTIFSEVPDTRPVRGLFCAAGIHILLAATELTPEQFRKVIDVNLTGSFLCAQAFAKEYLKRHSSEPYTVESIGVPGSVAEKGGASIVMMASMSAHISNAGMEASAYGASKAGVEQLGRNLAMEWGKRGIRVNTLSPGYIRTALTGKLVDERPLLGPLWHQGSLLGRLSTADEMRGPVVFLLSDASSYMTGADMIVDGGHTAV